MTTSYHQHLYTPLGETQKAPLYASCGPKRSIYPPISLPIFEQNQSIILSGQLNLELQIHTVD